MNIKQSVKRIFLRKKRSPIDFLRKRSNVQIAMNVNFAGDTSFHISNSAKKISFGENVGCRGFCNFLVFNDATLEIGNDVYFNNFCSVNCLGYISIGEGTLIGEGVKIYDHNHKYQNNAGELRFERSEFTIGSIKIGKNCWIGSNVTILNNVEIGDNTIIGANCLIYKSIPANALVKHNEDLIINVQ